MARELRPYQREAVDAVEASWAEGLNRPVLILPTGAGKSICIAEFVRRHVDRLRKEGLRTLVLAHREELLEQNEAEIKALVPGIWTAVLKGSRGQKTHQFADVVVASVQTLARPKRREAVDRIGLVIVDECHLYAAKTYVDVLRHYGCMDGGTEATPTVGMTATLTRLEGGLPDVWQSVAYEKPVHEMIRDGFLVPAKAVSVEIPGLNLATTRVTAGDLNAGDLSDALEGSAAFRVIAETYLERASDRAGIVFMPSVTTAQRQADALNEAGIITEVVTGATPSTVRKEIYGRYSRGETQVLSSVGVLTTGFNAPHTSCVVIGRPTLNPGLYTQMVGRALRLSPGKTDCLVLDIAGASLKHSLAGVNDLDGVCRARCECDCLSCGCTDRCKCGIRKCGCPCLELHEGPSAGCKCAGDRERCGCGCEGDPLETGTVHCICDLNDHCECRGDGDPREAKEVAADVLKNLVEVDILGEALASSGYTWLSTAAGIRYLPTGQSEAVFLLPSPEGDGFFQGLLQGFTPKAPVKRLDDGAVDADTALAAMEAYASTTGFTYNSRSASWRRTPASDAQLKLLRSMGIGHGEKVRKGEASDLLSNHKVTKALDHRFSKYLRQ